MALPFVRWLWQSRGVSISDPQPHFIATPAELRDWYCAHHATAADLWLGFHRRESGLPSLTYPEALDEALCWGWIDGIRKRWDATSYVQRFTPRSARSIWSRVNLAHAARLEEAGRMQPAGRAALARRAPERTGVYSFERETPADFSPERADRFAREAAAWRFFAAQAPSYRRTATHWVESAKREETRARRFAQLLADSRAQRRLAQLSSG